MAELKFGTVDMADRGTGQTHCRQCSGRAAGIDSDAETDTAGSAVPAVRVAVRAHGAPRTHSIHRLQSGVEP